MKKKGYTWLMQVCWSLFVVFWLIHSGCDKRRIVYKTDGSIAPPYWRWGDSLSLPFEVTDTGRIYNLWMQIRHTDDYPYQNLYTKLHTTFPDGRRLSQQVNFELADGGGRWQGIKKKGYYALELPIQERAFFDKSGTYRIAIEQWTRTDTLRGIIGWQFSIEDVGPRVAKNKK